MQPHQGFRIDLGDLKAQIVKRIGVDRSKRYFYYLNQFLSQKLSKVDFDKLCCRMLGRENLPLHNQFIRSILKNACQAKTPPSVYEADPAKPVSRTAKLLPSVEDGPDQNGSLIQNQNQSSSIWSNGVPQVSLRKSRSGIRERKVKDRSSPLGPNGKVESLYHSTATEDSGSKIMTENGLLTPCDYGRSLQNYQSAPGLLEKDGGPIQEPTDKSRAHSKSEVAMAIVEDGEEVDQATLSSFSRIPLLAPLGVPLCSASLGGGRKAMSVGNSDDFVSYHDTGELSDTESLRRRVQHIVATQGIGGVSVECANVLNVMLDIYLKRLIKSCIELVGARSTLEPHIHLIQKHQIPDKVLNGMWPASNHLHMRNNVIGGMPEKKFPISISAPDFKLAMELNPQQLGDDWPLLLEKISLSSFEK
ncbi:uncharacterized protein LOC115751020 [Rhodamnia argentea]|uniref:Uncharacterized protein LOC115751020 n=1 Tax=Rhodamnia argentea TaxID=178133 RepID=A0ABM3HAM4_9MYRT|nr:uncharacterized protein LOC115751020 [Rhodamnia argentea]XP_048133639.1 uncharacterized protein LOC115751020 [Rhodamnia argentea]